MEDVNVSSEQELRKLLEEGKITQEEYTDLEEAMRKSRVVNSQSAIQQTDKPKSKRKLGIAAFVLMLAGIILPIMSFFVCFSISGGGEGDVIFLGCLVLCVLLEISAFVFGVISWPDVFGKAATIASFLILIAGFLFVIGSMPRRVSIQEEKRQLTPLEATELERFPLDNMEGVVTQSGVQIDKEISSDGNGSLRIEAGAPIVIRLFETGDIDIEQARLIYQAKVRTENIQGQVYLEMWCHFPGIGDFFSRGLMTPLSGTTEWTTEETPFLLKAGENPDNVKLNLVINGKGTAWIDDIRLLKGPLK